MKMIAFAKGVGLAIVVTVAMLFAFGAETSECAAETNDNATSFTIVCGESHEAAAEAIVSYFNDPGFAYQSVTVVQNGTTVTGTGNGGLSVTQISYRIGDALMGGWMSNDKFYLDNVTHELLWRDMIGLKPITGYQNRRQFENEVSSNATTKISEVPNCTFYLLWEKPFDQSIKVSIDTPYCRSTEPPTVKCDTVTLTPSPDGGATFLEPVWYSTLPQGALNYPWDGNYTGVLEGGKQYYACASLGAPWGYYFPEGFSDVTFELRTGDVWDASSDDKYENLNVGCWITVGHVWSDQWTVTQEPTCTSEGIKSRPCTQGCSTFDTRPIDIDPDAHNWGAWKTTKKATALNKGMQQRVCGHNAAHVETRTLPATGVSGTLLAQMKASGKTKLKLTWTKINGAEGYDIFFAKCTTKDSKTKFKLVKTIKGNATFAWAKSGLKKQTAYKAQVKAFAYKNGKKTYVRTSPDVHVFTSGGSGKFTNPKSVSVNKKSVSVKTGRTFRIKGKVVKLSAKKKLIPKGHGPTLRYYSSNKAVAAVSSAGKITAKKAGKCTVYVLAVNGARKSIAVTVK